MCIFSSDDALRSPLILRPARSVTTIMSGVMKPFETLVGVVRMRSASRRTLMLPSFEATKPRAHRRRPSSTMSSRSCASDLAMRGASHARLWLAGGGVLVAARHRAVVARLTRDARGDRRIARDVGRAHRILDQLAGDFR